MSSACPPVRGSAFARQVPGDREARVELELRAGSGREGTDGAERAGVHEEGLPPAGDDAGRDQAGVQLAEILEPAESLEDVLERLDAVAEPGRLLVAEALGQVGEALPKAGQRPAGEELLELFRRGDRQRAGGERAPAGGCRSGRARSASW